MLEMALGQPPLQALDLAPPQILAQIADGPAPTLTPEQRSKFSKAFIDVISMCLDKNPARRYARTHECVCAVDLDIPLQGHHSRFAAA